MPHHKSFNRRLFAGVVAVFAVVFTVSASSFHPARSLQMSGNGNDILVRVSQNRDNLVSLEYMTPKAVLRGVSYRTFNGKSGEQILLGNSDYLTEPGKPQLPVFRARVIIPQGKSVKSVSLNPTEREVLDGYHLVACAEEPRIISESFSYNYVEPDKSVYESDSKFPTENIRLVSIQHRYGVAIAVLDIVPVEYEPLSGSLAVYRRFSVELKLAVDRSEGTGVKVRLDRFRNSKISEENLGAVNSYKDGALMGNYPRRIKNSRENYDYVLVTSQDFIDATTTPNVSDLIKLRETKGLSCKVVSIESVKSDYPGNKDSDKLRNFIKDAYNNWNTKFVLLGGDINVIPLRTVNATNGSENDDLPTDLPYQCLDGSSWNEDYDAEVFIGRISAETSTEFSNQIYKIIAYETLPSTDPTLTSGLGAGEKLDDQTYAKSSIKQIESHFDSDFSFDGIYDSDGTWSKNELISMINTSKYSIINHFGHCNTNYAMKLSNGDENKFTNNKFIFVKSQGCIPGAFDRDCIGERFTNSNRKGMFAVVFNSRYGWYQPGNPKQGSSHILHESFWTACYDKDMDYLGEFNEYSHRVNSQYRWDVLESNLLGDPATLFRGKEQPPYVQVMSPNGGEKWEVGRTFTIKWDDNIDENVDITLMNSDLSVKRILASDVKSNGSFDWAIPESLTLSDKYAIEVKSVKTDSLVDQSDNTFAIEEKSNLDLTSPDGGELLLKTKTYDITWTDDLDEAVKIDLFKGGKIYSTITASTPSNGKYSWTIPENIISGDDYKIRISGTDKDWLFDESKEVIAIDNPAITEFPYLQTFDDFDTGTIPLSEFWEQSNDDDLDWTVLSGPTPSKVHPQGGGTGPDTDHSGFGNYIYTEASGNNHPDKTMIVFTPKFDLSNVKEPKLSFWFHMFSKDGNMGTLSLEVYVDGKWESSPIVELSGDNGDRWNEKEVDLKDYEGKVIKFRFRGVTGKDYDSDMCIDDFKIDGIVNSSPEFVSSPVTTAKVGDKYSYEVNIEDVDGDAVTLTSNNLPQWISLSSDKLEGTPLEGDIGLTDTIELIADDGNSSPGIQKFTISVLAPDAPKIVTDISDQKAMVGDNVTFELVAEGFGLKYQWQCAMPKSPDKWEDLVLLNDSATLCYENVSKDDNNCKFRCIITNKGGADTSSVATLFVDEDAIVIKDIPSRISKFSVAPNPALLTDKNISIMVPEGVNGRGIVSVYDETGNLVDRESVTLRHAAKIEWDLCDLNGIHVNKGAYLLVLKVIEDNGSKHFYKTIVGIK